MQALGWGEVRVTEVGPVEGASGTVDVTGPTGKTFPSETSLGSAPRGRVAGGYGWTSPP